MFTATIQGSPVQRKRPLSFLKKTYRAWITLIILILPALWPLVRPGFFVSDDGRFHVYRIAALARAWSQGVLHPRLFPEFGFGYGQAVLNFYSPAGYWPGALLTFLGIGPAAAAQITIALGFVLAAFAMFGYIRSLWGETAGLIAALAYTYFPYHLADAYTRGAIPEHLAFIFPPFILWAYTAAFRKDDASSPAASSFTFATLSPFLWGALAWTGLVLTHNLTTLMMAPVALVHLALLAAWTHRWRRLLAAAGSLLLAMGMSAAYWLPVLVESSAVGLGAGPSRGYEHHLLLPAQLLARAFFYPYRDENGLALVYPLSWLTLGLLLLALALFLWRLWQRRRPPHSPLLGFHLALSGAALFMILTPSLFLWHPLTPLLGHLQYPWRFLVVAGLGLAGVAGVLPALLPRPSPRGWLAGLALLFMLVALPRLPYERLDLPAAAVWSPQRMWQEDADAGQVGATWTGEFLPTSVSEQRWALGRSREGAENGRAWTPQRFVISQRSYAASTVQTSSQEPWTLRLHQFFLPGWQARVDGQPAPVYPSGELGLVTVSVPAGVHEVEVKFGATPARQAGAWVSLLATGIWLALAVLAARKNRQLLLAATLVFIVTLALTLNGLGLGRRLEKPAPVQVQLDDVAMLVGYETQPARGARAVEVTLYWLALRETASDYTAFVHLLAADGQVIAQHDGGPVGGFSPTTRWRPGEIIPDTHQIPLPSDLNPGAYELRAGLYEFSEGEFRNLTTTPPTPDNRVGLGALTLP